MITIRSERHMNVAQLVEQQIANLYVAGSRPAIQKKAPPACGKAGGCPLKGMRNEQTEENAVYGPASKKSMFGVWSDRF